MTMINFQGDSNHMLIPEFLLNWFSYYIKYGNVGIRGNLSLQKPLIIDFRTIDRGGGYF